MAKTRKWIGYPQAEYRIWYGMVRRCHDPRDPYFARYGGRGIRVCDRWRDDFMAFLSDRRLRPSAEHSLDRRDNDGDYTPENCRWATRAVQQRNREVMLRANGATRAGGRWSARISINGRQIALGSFATKAEASRVYRRAAVQALIMTEVVAGMLSRPARNDRCAQCGATGTRALPAQTSTDPPPSGGNRDGAVWSSDGSGR